jgi:hypothetical protein
MILIKFYILYYITLLTLKYSNIQWYKYFDAQKLTSCKSKLSQIIIKLSYMAYIYLVLNPYSLPIIFNCTVIAHTLRNTVNMLLYDYNYVKISMMFIKYIIMTFIINIFPACSFINGLALLFML